MGEGVRPRRVVFVAASSCGGKADETGHGEDKAWVSECTRMDGEGEK